MVWENLGALDRYALRFSSPRPRFEPGPGTRAFEIATTSIGGGSQRRTCTHGSNPAHGMQREAKITQCAEVFVLPLWAACACQVCPIHFLNDCRTSGRLVFFYCPGKTGFEILAWREGMLIFVPDAEHPQGTSEGCPPIRVPGTVCEGIQVDASRKNGRRKSGEPLARWQNRRRSLHRKRSRSGERRDRYDVKARRYLRSTHSGSSRPVGFWRAATGYP